MPDAVFSVGPIPEPVSRYQGPLSFAMSMPASFHSLSSAECVPLRSAREANGARAALIFCRPATMSLPRALAGSDFGPTRTKSLYMTSRR